MRKKEQSGTTPFGEIVGSLSEEEREDFCEALRFAAELQQAKRDLKTGEIQYDLSGRPISQTNT